MNFWEDEIYLRKKQWNKWPFTEVISRISKIPITIDSNKAKVLEIGCGVGNNLIPIAEMGFDCTGIDLSSTALLEAKKRSQKLDLEIKFLEVNAKDMPFESNMFDVILDRSALTCSNPIILKQSLIEIFRVLKPGGLFLAFDWFGSNHPSLGDGLKITNESYGNFKAGIFKGYDVLTSFNFKSLEEHLKYFENLNLECVVKYDRDMKIKTEIYNFEATKPLN